MTEVTRVKRGFAAGALQCAFLALVTKTQALGEDEEEIDVDVPK